MKFKLGPLENARTFYSPKGNTTVIRDTVVSQVNPPQPEQIEPEPTKEEVVENVQTEITKPKITPKKNE